MKNIISLLSLVAFFNLGVALACGGKGCEECEGKSKKTTHTSKSGRKMKCTKCADHEEEKTEQKADAKPAETTATPPAKS